MVQRIGGSAGRHGDGEGSEPATVLIVDDEPANIDLLRGALGDTYRLKVATNGEKALQVAHAQPGVDLVLLDVVMPGMGGFEVCRRLKRDVATKDVPVLFVTSLDDAEDEAEGLRLGAVDYITKPISPPVVRARVAAQLALADQRRHLSLLVYERTRELEETRLQIIEKLGRAAEYKDDETGMHVVRVGAYTRIIAQEHGLSAAQADLFEAAAPMHDVGKIGIPDSVLSKPGKLDEDEWRVMQTHPQVGARIIGTSDHILLSTAREMALTHHERWDGSGYPNGLRGEDIPLCGRVNAIADVFDALTSARPYKPAWEVDRAVELIASEAGAHFDPELVPSFLNALSRIVAVKEAKSGPTPGEALVPRELVGS